MAYAVDNEQDFLTRVARALGRDKPLTVSPKRDEVGPPVFWREQKFESDQPLAFFKRNLEALTGKVVVVQNGKEANQQIKLWLKVLNAKTVIMWDHPELKEHIHLEETGIKVDYWSPARGRELAKVAEQADVGITWVDYAIGYTGTLALFSTPNQGRLVSLLPPTHIAVFRKSNLVPTMSAVISRLNEQHKAGRLPSAVEFITGPSRTSDIEMDLSIGVHGPSKVWTVVIDEGI
jgi:L-lactate dehydrogenase complex protein LldG